MAGYVVGPSGEQFTEATVKNNRKHTNVEPLAASRSVSTTAM